MKRIFSFFVRLTAFTGKELVEISRQRRLVLILIIGPFLILLLFGAGYREEAEPRHAVFVVAEGNPVREDVERFARDLGPQLIYEGTTASESRARRQLRLGEVDLVVVVPDDPVETVRENRQATFMVLHDEINPVQADFVRRLGQDYVDELNGQVQRLVIEEVRERGVPSGNGLAEIDSEVLVEPFLTEFRSIALVNPSLAHYFTPAALALLLQHMVLTFGALSIVRDRRMGAMELFHISPISAFEIVVGKYLAYMTMGIIVAALLTLAVVFGLGVALLGEWWSYALVIAALLFASLGLGFLISLLSRNDNQAVQYSMLVLLVSVFFGGFLVILMAIVEPIRYISWTLPVTYGIVLLRNVMFRGDVLAWNLVAVLLAIGTALMVASWMLLRRNMSRM